MKNQVFRKAQQVECRVLKRCSSRILRKTYFHPPGAPYKQKRISPFHFVCFTKISIVGVVFVDHGETLGKRTLNQKQATVVVAWSRFVRSLTYFSD
jgi:hypothetical protein